MGLIPVMVIHGIGVITTPPDRTAGNDAGGGKFPIDGSIFFNPAAGAPFIIQEHGFVADLHLRRSINMLI